MDIQNNSGVHLLDVLDEMERTGGSFVAALAVAWRRADNINRAKLKTAFSGYYEDYEIRVRRQGGNNEQ